MVNRTQFRHVVQGPTLWPQPGPAGEPSVAFFPGIRDLVVAGEWAMAADSVTKASQLLSKAADNLLGFF
jgi:N-acetylated-alpha-linked acidic dipeptidase